MLEKSVFTNKKEIINFVKEKYGINVTDIKIIDRGSANIYSLNGDEYILKEFQSKYTKEEIEKEITIINHLKKDDIKVPSYIKTINDTYYSIYKNKVIIIQKFIDGYTLNRNEGNYEQTIECAKVYGMIVKSLENLDILLPLNDLSYLFSKEIFEKSIEKHQELLKVINDKDDEETLNLKEFMKYREIDDNIRYSITNYIRHTMSDINDSLWHKSLYNEQIDLSEYEKLIEVIKVETTRLQKQEEQVKDTNTFKNISDAELDMYFKGVLSDEFIEVLKKRDFNESLRFIYKDNHKESNIVSNDNSSISDEKEEKTSNIIDFAEYSRRRKK